MAGTWVVNRTTVKILSSLTDGILGIKLLENVDGHLLFVVHQVCRLMQAAMHQVLQLDADLSFIQLSS